MKMRAFFLAASLALGCASASAQTHSETYGGRDMLVHVPPGTPRALVIVLHGGLGNADRIENRMNEAGMNLDALSDKYGFAVAYLNGTPITRFSQVRAFGWNAGACCGIPAVNKVDDAGYIAGAVNSLLTRWHIPRDHAFVIGHSNGAMMALRMMCDTRTFAAAISISGALETSGTSCPAAKGARVLAIHGADDTSVPVAGGEGAVSFFTFTFNSEAYTAKIFRDSGASYDLKIVPGAEHALEGIDAALQTSGKPSISNQAVQFFGLSR
jgi:poly(3-hydroxybutyrate) depolymerase